MNNFIFQTTATIINEPGVTSRLGEIAASLGMHRVLLVSDPGIAKIGLLELAESGLRTGGMEVSVFAEVLADPPVDNIMAALNQAREFNADGVIGFGGGSSMDVAKLIAFLSNSEQGLAEIYGVGIARGKRLPLILVTTTAGTGSEVTPIAIVTTGENEKKGVVSPLLLPDIAILDAELTVGLPPRVTAMTGIDAMVHAIEAYTTRVKKNPISDTLARQGLKLLFENIRAAIANGHDLEARSKMLVGALLAGQAFANAPVGAVHALAYPIGGQYHVAHGLSNSLVLPHVMRFNLPVASREYAELARELFSDLGTTSDLAAGARLIGALEQLMVDVQLETRLNQVGIGKEALPVLAEAAMLQTRLLVNNPRDVGYEDALQIYRDAW
ncbi:1,3-propanediol dehydrogenase [Desulfuromonas sp. DDH964]|uniref:iron-containing alcohol dehydrogenase n=1 Tax=Desulfuromonas sp. DDH964 TaxID=1823759 RepID=UPI00078E2A9A|nr:iron-containing alcohol dehydrogenase [Desulfuromonas sp. DDH964]AMV71923.1 1,3-propanediol dehydrogenase [Desulfuromonas sp. DDH964]